MSDTKAILILTTDAGSGHRSAAEALEAAFDQLYGPAARLTVCNPWHHERAPAFWRRYEQLYLDEVQHAPALYSCLPSGVKAHQLQRWDETPRHPEGTRRL